MIAATGWNVSSSDVVAAGILVVSLMVLNALFHAAEAALSGLRRSRVLALAEAGDKRAAKLSHLHEHSSAYYATCEIGFQISRVGIVTATVLASPPLAAFLSASNPPGAAPMFGAVVLLIALVALINVTFVELLFRGIARKNPDTWASRLHGFLKVSRVVLSPIVGAVHLIGGRIAKRLGTGQLFSPPAITEEELIEIVEATEQSGELIEDEKEMIHSVIEFTDTVAREVMTPRIDIDAADVNTSAEEISKIVHESGHSRIPIYEGSIDRIIGVVHAKDLLRAISDGNGHSLREIMRPAYSIPESKDLHSLLAEFRRGRNQMAIVQDEYGGTAGLVTIEDLVEEIVGDIVDEYDVEEIEIQELDSNVWLIDGRTHVDDVNDEIGSMFDSEEFDTIGGFVFGQFGRQPAQGESIVTGHWELEVADTDGRRVNKVRATKRTEAKHSAN
jgi:putative hemolysin